MVRACMLLQVVFVYYPKTAMFWTMKHAKSALTALEKAIRDFDEKGRNSQLRHTMLAWCLPRT